MIVCYGNYTLHFFSLDTNKLDLWFLYAFAHIIHSQLFRGECAFIHFMCFGRYNLNNYLNGAGDWCFVLMSFYLPDSSWTEWIWIVQNFIRDHLIHIHSIDVGEYKFSFFLFNNKWVTGIKFRTPAPFIKLHTHTHTYTNMFLTVSNKLFRPWLNAIENGNRFVAVMRQSAIC